MSEMYLQLDIETLCKIVTTGMREYSNPVGLRIEGDRNRLRVSMVEVDVDVTGMATITLDEIPKPVKKADKEVVELTPVEKGLDANEPA